MQLDYSHQMVRRLGLKMFAVYFLMACAEQEGLTPITRKWLLEQMPYNTSPNTVTDALRWLTSPENQLAVRVTGGWRLATAVQLPLMVPLEDGFEAKSALCALLATTTTIKNRRGFKDKSLTVVVEGEKRAERAFEDFTDEQKAIWQIGKKIGIGEPTRTRIALQTDYPPEYVWAHGIYGAREGLDLRLIIHRIQQKDWLPETVKEEARASVDQFFDESENE